jgi:hypothetical protein
MMAAGSIELLSGVETKYRCGCNSGTLARSIESYYAAGNTIFFHAKKDGGAEYSQEMLASVRDGYKLQSALGHDAFRDPFEDRVDHLVEFPLICRNLKAFIQARGERFRGAPSTFENLLEAFLGIDLNKSVPVAETLEATKRKHAVYRIRSRLPDASTSRPLYLGVATAPEKATEFEELVLTQNPNHFW